MLKNVILFAALVAAGPCAFARQPTGEGDPAERHCMHLEAQTGSLGGGSLCKTNAEWARMKADGIVLDDSGRPKPPKDARDVASHDCTTTAGASGPARVDCH